MTLARASSARAALAAAILLAVAGVLIRSAWHEGQRRALIPVAIDGRIAGFKIYHEKHPGQDDRYVITVGADLREIEVDAAVYTLLGQGGVIRKDAGARIVHVGPRETDDVARDVPLRPLRETTRLVMALIAGLVPASMLALLGWLRRGPT